MKKDRLSHLVRLGETVVDTLTGRVSLRAFPENEDCRAQGHCAHLLNPPKNECREVWCPYRAHFKALSRRRLAASGHAPGRNRSGAQSFLQQDTEE